MSAALRDSASSRRAGRRTCRGFRSPRHLLTLGALPFVHALLEETENVVRKLHCASGQMRRLAPPVVRSCRAAILYVFTSNDRDGLVQRRLDDSRCGVRIVSLDAGWVAGAPTSCPSSAGAPAAAGLLVDGTPPCSQRWSHRSAEYMEPRKMGDKYAKFRAFAVEMLASLRNETRDC